jgi:3'(2'), 5'-bisphosphate nucleotidase
VVKNLDAIHPDLLFYSIQAAIAAVDGILEVYRQDTTESVSKADKSPLSQADRASNAILSEYLGNTGIPIIREEINNESYRNRKDREECWMIDPLEATKEYINRNAEFTVNIVLLIDGKL